MMTRITVSPGGPLGVFDSGVGGLSVLPAIQAHMPHEDILYLADQGHVPYGPRSLAEVRGFSEAITRYLLEAGAKLIVVACHTASAAALTHLRATFPEVQFVGMEPAVKPAAETTDSGVVGVLATAATFQGELYASVVERFAQDVRVLPSTCPGLVRQIEAGDLTGSETRRILEEVLTPMLAEGIDAVVLGCTHYPFVADLIGEIAGPGVRIIEPSEAIARQTQRLLMQSQLANDVDKAGVTRYLTSGDPAEMQRQIESLLGVVAQPVGLTWEDDIRLVY